MYLEQVRDVGRRIWALWKGSGWADGCMDGPTVYLFNSRTAGSLELELPLLVRDSFPYCIIYLCAMCMSMYSFSAHSSSLVLINVPPCFRETNNLDILEPKTTPSDMVRARRLSWLLGLPHNSNIGALPRRGRGESFLLRNSCGWIWAVCFTARIIRRPISPTMLPHLSTQRAAD